MATKHPNLSGNIGSFNPSPLSVNDSQAHMACIFFVLECGFAIQKYMVFLLTQEQ